MARVVVTGWVAPFPTAGFLWHPLGFALGFAELGHEVWYVEDSGYYPGWDPVANRPDPECLAGARLLEAEMGAVGFGGRWAFRNEAAGTCHGMTEEEVGDVLAGADVLVNVSLNLPRRPEYERIPVRLAIDTDPVFVQINVAEGHPLFAAVPEWHTRLFTFGRPPLPAQRHEWVPTRQAVSGRHWPVAGPASSRAAFTSVTTWKAYGDAEWDGVTYGTKERELRRFIDLPSRTRVPLALAVGGGLDREEGRRELAAHGWGLLDPLPLTSSTAAYRRFLTGSAGEIGMAKHAYVAARTGWFSERTCLYLATGRPAVVQDTGWSEWLPAGKGLFAFSTPEEAVAALEEAASDPAAQGRAARSLVEEHFDAARVCAALLDAV